MESNKCQLKEFNEIRKTIQDMYIEFSNEIKILKKQQTKIKLEIKSEYVLLNGHSSPFWYVKCLF